MQLHLSITCFFLFTSLIGLETHAGHPEEREKLPKEQKNKKKKKTIAAAIVGGGLTIVSITGWIIFNKRKKEEESRKLAEQQERQRLEEEKRKKLAEEEAEKKRKEQERLEKKRLEEEKRKKLAKEAEKKRKEKERLEEEKRLAEEKERRRLDKIKKKKEDRRPKNKEQKEVLEFINNLPEQDLSKAKQLGTGAHGSTYLVGNYVVKTPVPEDMYLNKYTVDQEQKTLYEEERLLKKGKGAAMVTSYGMIKGVKHDEFVVDALVLEKLEKIDWSKMDEETFKRKSIPLLGQLQEWEENDFYHCDISIFNVMQRGNSFVFIDPLRFANNRFSDTEETCHVLIGSLLDKKYKILDKRLKSSLNNLYKLLTKIYKNLTYKKKRKYDVYRLSNLVSNFFYELGEDLFDPYIYKDFTEDIEHRFSQSKPDIEAILDLGNLTFRPLFKLFCSKALDLILIHSIKILGSNKSASPPKTEPNIKPHKMIEWMVLKNCGDSYPFLAPLCQLTYVQNQLDQAITGMKNLKRKVSTGYVDEEKRVLPEQIESLKLNTKSNEEWYKDFKEIRNSLLQDLEKRDLFSDRPI